MDPIEDKMKKVQTLVTLSSPSASVDADVLTTSVRDC